MLHTVRECGKLGCRRPAAATAALRYAERVLWIGDLLTQRDPNLLDLCAEHAEGMTAPYGWGLLHEREAGEPAADSLPLIPGGTPAG